MYWVHMLMDCTLERTHVDLSYHSPLQAEFAGSYDLFLLEDKEEKPTVVVLPQVCISMA